MNLALSRIYEELSGPDLEHQKCRVGSVEAVQEETVRKSDSNDRIG